MVSSARMDGVPKPWMLATIALVCALAGFAVSRASLDVDRAALAAERETARAEAASADDDARAPQPTPAAENADAEAEGPADVEPAGDAASEPETQQGATEVPTSEGIAQPVESGPATLTLGRIAYIRCDGAPEAAAGACPRDLSVERRVTAALQTLTNCEGLAGKTGAGDVRVVFASGLVSGLGFRDLGAEGVDREAVRACLEPRLAQLRTSLPTTRMTVAFQFELRR